MNARPPTNARVRNRTGSARTASWPIRPSHLVLAAIATLAAAFALGPNELAPLSVRLSVALLAVSSACYAACLVTFPVTTAATVLRYHPQLIHAAIALAAAVVTCVLHPYNLPVDDAAIIMRYLENLRDGYVYRYNPQDPPIFGVSSPIHYLVAGIFTYTDILSPKNSLYASNFIGLCGVYYLTFRILAYYINDPRCLYPSWAFTVLTAQTFLLTTRIGMEAPLHLALVLAAFRLFQLHSRWVWPMLTLIVVSKLDAVPVALLLGVCALFRDRPIWMYTSARIPYGTWILGSCIAPLLAWIAFATWFFGSPMPHSAKAKLYKAQDASGQPFAFIADMPDLHWTILCIAIYLVYCIVWFARKRQQPSQLLFAPAGILVICLYLIFNPAEKMMWYYALPDFLIKLQASLILFLSVQALRRPLLITIPALILLHTLYLPPRLQQAEDAARYFYYGQGQWIQPGKWIDQHAKPDAVVLAALGYPAWSANRYIVDASGINSKVGTQAVDWTTIIDLVDPDYVFTNQLIGGTRHNGAGYTLVNSYYNIIEYGEDPWRLYQRGTSPHTTADLRIPQNWIRSSGPIDVQTGWQSTLLWGRRVIIRPPNIRLSARELALGILLGESPGHATATVYPQSPNEPRTISIDIPSRVPGDIARQTIEWRIPLPQTNVAAIELLAEYQDSRPPGVIYIDPILVGLSNSPH